MDREGRGRKGTGEDVEATAAVVLKDDFMLRCLVCGRALAVRVSHSRRGHRALSFACPVDGRHIRGFINDARTVGRVLADGENAPSGELWARLAALLLDARERRGEG